MVVEILHDSHGWAAVMLRAFFTVKEIEARLLRHHLHVSQAFHPRMLEPNSGRGPHIPDCLLVTRGRRLGLRIH